MKFSEPPNLGRFFDAPDAIRNSSMQQPFNSLNVLAGGADGD